jgi:GNAT superfamily N-acetyltransferase
VLRQTTLDDSAAAVDLLALVGPETIFTVDGYRHAWESSSPEAHRSSWCIEVDGECVGWSTGAAMVDTTQPGMGWAGVTVHPAHRGRGFGAALLESAERHLAELGTSRILSWSRSEDASTAFARSHAYEQTASNEVLVVDPREIDAPVLPAGVELRPFTAFEDDPSPIYRVDSVAFLDEPGEATQDALTYESWLDRFWRHPALDREASTAVLLDGEAVAVTMLITDRASGRGENNGTGTLPEHRGRGLALLAKQASLVRSAELGCTTVYTRNDATNAPMLAINRRLGYRLNSFEYTWGKTLAVTSEG